MSLHANMVRAAGHGEPVDDIRPTPTQSDDVISNFAHVAAALSPHENARNHAQESLWGAGIG
jgi:hypothetical protein